MEFGAATYYILGEVIACSLSILLCVNILLTFSAYDKRQRLFLYAGISTFLASAFNIGAVFCISNFQSLSPAFCTFISTCYFIFLMFCPFSMSNYAVDIATTFSRKRRLGYCINGSVYAVYLVLVLLNLKTGWIFSYSPAEGYVRGPLKNITYGLTVYYSAMIMLSVIVNRKMLAKRIFWVFMAYPFVSLVFVLLQFMNNRLILTGIASFAATFFAYITVQSYFIEVDMSTGLMVEARLKRKIAMSKQDGVLYVFNIDNMNLIQSSMDVSDFNKMFLNLGDVFNANFPRNAYHIATNRFVAIGKSIEDVSAKSEIIKKYINDLKADINSIIPIPIDYYSVAMNFSRDDDYDAIMDIVNNMLVKAKQNQLRKMQVCDESVLVDRERKRYIYHILKRELALESEQFQVWFQPIFSLQKRHFTYMEALSRLKNTELGDISPAEFVYVAENRGLIERLGFVAFEKVCKFISDNRDVVDAVSINFSVYQMTNLNLVQNVLGTLERFSLKPSNIIMEITESIFIENYDLVRANMCQLAQAGVKFYLDDFGTGYSNLANVASLPFSTIKIDRSLVLMMEENERGVNLFMNLVNTFKDAGFTILVEGVETNNQNYLVEKAGVDYIQGFLYSRPLNPENCIDVLKKDRLA